MHQIMAIQVHVSVDVDRVPAVVCVGNEKTNLHGTKASGITSCFSH